MFAYVNGKASESWYPKHIMRYLLEKYCPEQLENDENHQPKSNLFAGLTTTW